MSRCAMVWTTAGTNRVCQRCLALKGTVVGYTDEVGVQLPPLHPRCRCAIDYREVGELPRGLAAGNIDILTTEGSPPKLIERIEFKPAVIQKTLERYEAQIVKSPVEHAIIITTAGEVWHCNGDLHGIPFSYFERLGKRLEGAHVTHNHPPDALENDNTFSNEDLSLFTGFKLARLRGVDLKFLYELNRNPNDLDFEELTFGELMSLMAGETKDAHRYVGLKAKMEGIGYRRWSR